jgi:hypothetical protein
MSKTKPDILIVITDAAKDQAAIFPLTDVTGFDLRGNGALAILNGKEIVNAYAAGYWQRAFFYTQAKFEESNAKAAEAVELNNAAAKAAEELNNGDNVVPIAP